MREFDREFQEQVEAYRVDPPGTLNQRSEVDRHDKAEGPRETREDQNS